MDHLAHVRRLRCYAHSEGAGWEGICLDLDIAVQANSLEEVVLLLNEAVGSYIEDAKAEEAATARRLLDRRAPLGVRLRYLLAAMRHLVSGDRRRAEASFDVLCPV